ncbi:hypothetical protein J4E85_002749 [Alternaria conjuncta]|uniref:uncharacterized protein n=1 Tax=Alternaria conjuncta TaxID=181017 RepID=UPI00221F391C|nr:uncharacterized protein J4E85_002749 [Alternaria conjuncta]KAI4934887.1 hypothetical protein J4E85_002749 [Alternaria conjuncta]
MDSVTNDLTLLNIARPTNDTNAFRDHVAFVPSATPYQQIAARRAGLSLVEDESRFERSMVPENDSEVDEDGSGSSDEDADERTPLALRFNGKSAVAPAAPSSSSASAQATDPCLKSRQLWLRLLREQGYDALCQDLLKDELNVRWAAISSSVAPRDQGWMAYYGRNILASADRTLLEAIIHGNVALQRRANSGLERYLQALWKQSYKQPSIYQQLFVDVNGHSPTPNELNDMCISIERYLDPANDAYADKVDDKFKTKAKSRRASCPKYRAYTWTEQVDPKKKNKLFAPGKAQNQHYSWMVSGDRVRNIHTFLKALRTRLAAIPKVAWDKPLEHPLVEYGYAEDSPARLKQHAKHSSSNYIMNLMEAVACEDHRLKQLNKVYRLEQCVIYLIWLRPQAHLSEIIWTSLGEGYIYNGGGFSHYPAGRSNTSIWNTSEKIMEDAHEYMRKNSPLLENLKIDTLRVKNLCDDLQTKRRAAEAAQGPSKSSKMADLMEKSKEIHVEDLRKLKRAEEALNESLSFSYRTKIERNQILVSEAQERVKVLRELNDIASALDDPEMEKWWV